MINYTFSLLDFEKWLLILARISGFVFVAPFFGTKNIPSRTKVGFSVFVALMVSGMIDKSGIEYTGMIGYAIIVLKEGITGLLIGFAANICNSIILFAGNIIDMDIGLSMAQEFDPMMNTQVTISGNLYNYFVLLMLIATNTHFYILRAIVDCFQLIPVNGQVFRWDNLLLTMIQFLTDLFVIAFRIILPIFICMMILNCVLGIMAKVAPQMNMFSVGMQIKILVGLGVLFITTVMFSDAANFIFGEIKRMVMSVIEGLH